MTAVDVVIWVVLGAFAFKGALNGFAREVFTLAGIVLGGWGASAYAPDVSSRIRPFLHIPENVSLLLSFVLVFLLVIVVSALLAHLVTAALRLVMLGWMNRLAGLLVGLLQGFVALAIALHFAARCPSAQIRSTVGASRTASVFVSSWGMVEGGWHRLAALGPVLQKKEEGR
ncbi:MAG TPA: CvpA family protein [Verrucomicrobiae bacterium]|nr:CvpA family protein [Verrucomicrobiae bacterium]